MITQAFASPGEALEHHGVKGMKWGVRKKEDLVGRDPMGKIQSQSPTPALSERKQAKVDKFLKDAKLAETRISELKIANSHLEGTRDPRKLYKRSINNDLIKQTEKQRKQAVKDAEAVHKGKLTKKQKEVIAGAVVVGAIVGYGFYARGSQSGAFNSWKLMGQAKLKGESVPFKVNRDLSRKMSAEELLTHIAKPVNPGYSQAGGKMNCRRATYAYELRRRGYDVHATTSAVGWGQSESGVINALTTDGKDYFRATSMSETVVKTGFSSVAEGDTRISPGAKILLSDLSRKGEDFSPSAAKSSSARVLEELAKQPNGARGEVLFKFSEFGHSMAYEIVDGVPKIFDSQKGTMYDATNLVEHKWDGFSAAEIRRLDNVDLDLNFLTRWATNNG